MPLFLRSQISLLMKNKILELLKTKFVGVDEKTLERIAEKLGKTTESEEDVKTAVDGVTFQQVLESYGDARATQAQQTAVSNYEKQHKLKDGKPIDEPKTKQKKEGEGDGDELPEWAKAIQAQNEALQKQLKSYEAEKLSGRRMAKLDELLKDAPDNVKNMYKNNFAQMKWDDEASFDAWLESNKTTIEGLTNDFKAKGAVVHQPLGGRKQQKPGEADPLVVERAERMAKQAEAAPSVFMGLNNNQTK